MAKDSLGDDFGTVNLRCPFCNNNLTAGETDWQDLVDENIAKAKALITVASLQGISNCNEGTQHHYLSVIEDLICLVFRGFQQLSK